MRRLVVTGDDFGFSRGVNRAIVEAHEKGVLTSASLMVTGDAWEEAVSLARAHPRLAVGLHLVIVCGRSVLSRAEVPHLVDHAGFFRTSPTRAGLLYQLHPAARAELRREIRAQLERFQQTGLPLDHVDGHLHLHVHPVVVDVLAELAAEFGIPAVRFPSEDFRLALRLDRTKIAAKVAASTVFGLLRRQGARRLRAAGVAVADRVYGLHSTGRVNEGYLARLAPRIGEGWTEIYCHPASPEPGEPLNGPPGAGARELAALVSARVRSAIASEDLILTTSREVVAASEP